LPKVDFTGAELQGASLDGAQLQGASLQLADLQAADLSEAFLWRTNRPGLSRATLQTSNFPIRPTTGFRRGGVTRITFGRGTTKIIRPSAR
jgi:uncharacterized protein YjbI with pentapeptide repeats